jgi:hypothetical protein
MRKDKTKGDDEDRKNQKRFRRKTHNAFAKKHIVGKRFLGGEKEKNENKNRNVGRISTLHNAAGISGAC